MNASGCGVQVKEYGHLLARDPKYAAKARRVSEMTKDVSEFLPAFAAELQTRITQAPNDRVVFHPPCTLQHGQQIRGAVENLLASLGAEVEPFAESHMCCGSAGTYSVLQPELAYQLRDRKLDASSSGRTRCDSVGEYRLHHASCQRHHDARNALDRMAGRAITGCQLNRRGCLAVPVAS